MEAPVSSDQHGSFVLLWELEMILLSHANVKFGHFRKNQRAQGQRSPNFVLFFIKNSKLPWWNAITCAVTLWKKNDRL